MREGYQTGRETRCPDPVLTTGAVCGAAVPSLCLEERKRRPSPVTGRLLRSRRSSWPRPLEPQQAPGYTHSQAVSDGFHAQNPLPYGPPAGGVVQSPSFTQPFVLQTFVPV